MRLEFHDHRLSDAEPGNIESRQEKQREHGGRRKAAHDGERYGFPLALCSWIIRMLTTTSSIADELLKLDRLKSEKSISDEEYLRLRARLVA